VKVALVNPTWSFDQANLLKVVGDDEALVAEWRDDAFSDIQEERPAPLPQLERACCGAH